MTLGDFITTLKLPFRKDRGLYRSFHKLLGFYPNDIRPYRQALLHKSFRVRGAHGQRLHNERLEFLGDAILGAVVGDIVYAHFKNKPEGFLTTTRSKIVQRESLNRIAIEMGLDKLIKFDGRSQNAHNNYICGNAFEALVGAIYLDRGYKQCMRFVEKQILKRLINIDKVAYKEVNFKSKLLEWGQKNRIKVDFRLLAEGKEGAASATFLTRVVIEGIACGEGKGYTKKESQQIAAKNALLRLKKQKELEERIFEAKGKRTAMEEQPLALLPDIAEDAVPVREERDSHRVKRGSAAAKRAEARRTKPAAESAPATETAQELAKDERPARKDCNRKPRKEEAPVAPAEPVADPPKAEPTECAKQPAVALKTEKAERPEHPVTEESKTEAQPTAEQPVAAEAQDEAQQGGRPRRPRRPRRERKPQGEAASPVAAADPGESSAAAGEVLPIASSDVSMREKSRNEIISAAETQAFAED